MIEVLIEFFYLLVTAVIWSMLVYQGVLTFGGYLYSRRKKYDISGRAEWPFITVLVPARNEEKVIAQTVDRLIHLDYPADRLEVIIANDGSTDRTREILESIKDPRLTVLNIPVEESGKGKSRVLNRAVKQAKGELIAIYDADNRPEPTALKYLVMGLEDDPSYVAAIGKFRCINKDRSIMTRFINIESLTFQWIIQAGRSFFFRIAMLPGTNFIIKKKAVMDVGGWDEKALTEDAELSLRLYRSGGITTLVSQSITWEQEPESVKVWLRQRERWVRGNNYVMAKMFVEFKNFQSRAIGVEFFFFSLMQYIFFSAMLVSDIFFLLGLLNIVSVPIQGPFLEVWIAAYMLFVSEIVLMLSREQGEDSPQNIFYVILMYFTYCQLWLVVMLSAFIKDFIKKEKFVWYKTERTAEVK